MEYPTDCVSIENKLNFLLDYIHKRFDNRNMYTEMEHPILGKHNFHQPRRNLPMTLYRQKQPTGITWPEPLEITWHLLGGESACALAPRLPHLGLQTSCS